MPEIFNIFFIDDELNSSDETHANVRVALVNQLNKDKRFNVTPFHPVDFIRQSSEGEIKISPDLIIIDYKLSGGSNTASKRYHGTGYSMTSYCKERFADVPCYLISQLINEDISASEHYDKKLSHGFLTKQIGRDTLAGDCNAYRILKSTLKESQNEVLIKKVLNVPDEELANLKIAIPSEFWNELYCKEPQGITDSESIIIKFTKWINTTFIPKRGPLINSLELATLLGITEEFFETGVVNNLPIKNYFSENKYTGIFHKTSRGEEKWWAQQCFNTTIDMTNGENSAEPWKVFPVKMGIHQKNWSCCPVCSKNYPETVATDKESRNDYACHWACCIAGDISDDIAGFEPQLYLNI